jgi:hypothetical protein
MIYMSMLAYLITSSTRRRLLELLWSRRMSGTVSSLAETAGLAYAGAYRELQRMVRHGLATRTVHDRENHYAAAFDHPDAELLQRLLAAPLRRPRSEPNDDVTRGRLRTLGAPLAAEALPVPEGALESVLVEGVELARRDATVARVLPIVFWRARDALNRERLEQVARERHQKQGVGFMLALAGHLGGDTRVTRWSSRLRDHRVSTLRPFFEVPSTRAAELTAERRAPDLARRWGFAMNLGLDDLRAQFEKFAQPRDDRS